MEDIIPNEQTLREGEGQGGLACCSAWGRKVRHDWATERQQTQHYTYSMCLPCLTHAFPQMLNRSSGSCSPLSALSTPCLLTRLVLPHMAWHGAPCLLFLGFCVYNLPPSRWSFLSLWVLSYLIKTNPGCISKLWVKKWMHSSYKNSPIALCRNCTYSRLTHKTGH